VITALGRPASGASTFALCEDEAVIGTAFYVMDCVHGRIITDPAIPDVTPRERGLIYDSLKEVLARLQPPTGRRFGSPTSASRQLLRPPDPPLGRSSTRVRDGEESNRWSA